MSTSRIAEREEEARKARAEEARRLDERIVRTLGWHRDGLTAQDLHRKLHPESGEQAYGWDSTMRRLALLEEDGRVLRVAGRWHAPARTRIAVEAARIPDADIEPTLNPEPATEPIPTPEEPPMPIPAPPPSSSRDLFRAVLVAAAGRYRHGNPEGLSTVMETILLALLDGPRRMSALLGAVRAPKEDWRAARDVLVHQEGWISETGKGPTIAFELTAEGQALIPRGVTGMRIQSAEERAEELLALVTAQPGQTPAAYREEAGWTESQCSAAAKVLIDRGALVLHRTRQPGPGRVPFRWVYWTPETAPALEPDGVEVGPAPSNEPAPALESPTAEPTPLTAIADGWVDRPPRKPQPGDILTPAGWVPPPDAVDTMREAIARQDKTIAGIEALIDRLNRAIASDADEVLGRVRVLSTQVEALSTREMAGAREANRRLAALEERAKRSDEILADLSVTAGGMDAFEAASFRSEIQALTARLAALEERAKRADELLDARRQDIDDQLGDITGLTARVKALEGRPAPSAAREEWWTSEIAARIEAVERADAEAAAHRAELAARIDALEAQRDDHPPEEVAILRERLDTQSASIAGLERIVSGLRDAVGSRQAPSVGGLTLAEVGDGPNGLGEVVLRGPRSAVRRLLQMVRVYDEVQVGPVVP